ncbi:MAG: Crp/Fnr family transcriptional regulator, partial [Desulfamplus sp.]|nr:Crp/Fnr family transcriptional regulator [Desulfamplus sp.]
AKDIQVNVRAIDPGEAFGLSVVLNRDNCSMTAICDEAATIFVINGNALRNLMEEDHSMGYLFMRHTSKVLHKRWLMRTEQFVKTLKSHPDISALEVM